MFESDCNMNHYDRDSLGSPKARFLSAAAVFLFAFACFCPNPALPLGGSTGLQIGQVMALLSLPIVVLVGIPKRQALVSLLLLLPVLLSGFLIVALERVPSVEVALKTQIATALVFVVLVPVGRATNKSLVVPLLCGAACAIVLNAGVGAYQAYQFARDEFPLPGIYQNPSFNSFITQDPERYALYVKRPFGLFPEPSAMAASIGPWLILAAGLLLYPKLRQSMTRGAIAQLLLALVCGASLIILSSSGFTVWLLASLFLVSVPYLKGRVLRLHRPSNLVVLIALVVVGAVLVGLSSAYVGARLDVQENASWSSRLASIVWSLSYLGNSVGNLLFGVGPGQSYLILQSSSMQAASFGGIAVTAVWSLLANYVLETGLFGALALTLVLVMVVHAIVRSSARLLGFSCFMAWLAGVLLTTSYLPLLPLWLFLGVLLGWDRIFRAPPTAKNDDPRTRVPTIPEAVRT